MQTDKQKWFINWHDVHKMLSRKNFHCIRNEAGDPTHKPERNSSASPIPCLPVPEQTSTAAGRWLPNHVSTKKWHLNARIYSLINATNKNMLREYAKEAGQSASQLDAEIRPSMAHKVHQNFAKNICGASSLFVSIFLSVSSLLCVRMSALVCGLMHVL